IVFGRSVFSLIGTCLRLRIMSVASSTTPGIEENSCSTPSIFTAVIAAPSMELSSARRRAFPTVVPQPRSSTPLQPPELFRVQLHDQLLVECRGLHVFALRHGHHFGLELFTI